MGQTERTLDQPQVLILPLTDFVSHLTALWSKLRISCICMRLSEKISTLINGFMVQPCRATEVPEDGTHSQHGWLWCSLYLRPPSIHTLPLRFYPRSMSGSWFQLPALASQKAIISPPPRVSRHLFCATFKTLPHFTSQCCC